MKNGEQTHAFDPNYPRPQLRRENWTNLNGPWRFCFDDEGRWNHPREVERWTHTIQVPFAPETARSGIEDTSFHPFCWYEREFDLKPDQGRVLLHFGAVDYHAKVWINDQFVTEHEGGHTPFCVDITACLKTSGPQRLTVWVQDDPHDLAKPRGKQDWQLEPHNIWYPRTTGIWQTVWLERVPHTYIERILWAPHFERWEIGFVGCVAGKENENLRIRVKLYIDEKVLVDDIYHVSAREVHRRIALSDPGIDDYRNEMLWSPEKPTILYAEIELHQGDTLLDRVQSYTAMRTVDIQRNRFLLNGRPYYLRLVLDQGYWTDSFMTPPDSEALRRDVELVKQMGFNGVRKHQKIEDPRFLYWADTLGLLVWEEMPSAYRFTAKSIQRLTREWSEVIARDSSHPCIVVWVPFNESWGVPDLTATAAHRHYVQGLYHITKSLDASRPVIGNDGWENLATDIVGIHDYEIQPADLAARYGANEHHSDEFFERLLPAGRQLALDDYAHHDQPVMLTEFGGIAYTRRTDTDTERNWGYSTSRSAEELQEHYSALLAIVNRIERFSGFCYTQFTDTFQEANGLLYADRTPKFPLEAIARSTKGLGLERRVGDENEQGSHDPFHK